jgi:hypothetical protein
MGKTFESFFIFCFDAIYFLLIFFNSLSNVGDLIFNVISAYAPQISLNKSIKRQFWEQLDALVSSVSIYEKLFIGGDLNGHVGSTRVGFDAVYGGFGYGSRNQEGERILNFALPYDLFVTNTLFRKRVSHLVTFSSG